MRTYADGQLPASAAALFTAGQDGNYPSDGNVGVALTLANTSASLTETVTITFQRQGGTARRIAHLVLLPNEAAVIDGLPMSMGDIILGVTSDATTVDYVLGASATGPLTISVFDSNGALRQVNGTTVTGAITATSLAVTAGMKSSGATGAGIGYATGAGGAVTQITSRATGVTLNTLTGAITTINTSLAALATATFTVTNSTVAVGDTVIVCIRSGQTNTNTTALVSAVAAGSFNISIVNGGGAAQSTAETGAIILNYAVIKAVSA